ncbi:hypothetical protein GF351_00225 [Candidatus Woesearchaeota archaeon]|nr:hypothetical protein [Candidatus Woesearchaeota archaeon]
MSVKEVLWRDIIFRYFFRFLYITGLTLIVPYLFTSEIPEEIWFMALSQRVILYIAAVLVIISLLGMMWAKKDLGKALQSMGLMTLIPGFISLLVTLYGQDVFMEYITRYEWSTRLEPVINIYLQSSLPKLWILTMSFVVLGVVLFIIGMLMRE